MLKLLEYVVALLFIVFFVAIILSIFALAIPVGILIALYFIFFRRNKAA